MKYDGSWLRNDSKRLLNKSGMFTRGLRALKSFFRVWGAFLKNFCSGNPSLRDLLRKSSFHAEPKTTFSESGSWRLDVLFEAVSECNLIKLGERRRIIYVYQPKKYFGEIFLKIWFSDQVLAKIHSFSWFFWKSVDFC